MPAYNCAPYLKDSVLSVLAQTDGSYELLIIDDGSTDETPEILSKFAEIDSRIINIRNERNYGISDSLNTGLEIAKGRYVARMDADDVAHKSRFEKQLKKFRSIEDLVLCGTNAMYVNQRLVPLWATFLPLSDWDIRSIFPFENPFAHPTIMMKKEVVLAIGGYNVIYETTQDYDLWGRLLKQGRVCNLDSIGVYIRRHDSSVSARKSDLQRENTFRVQNLYVSQFLDSARIKEYSYDNVGRVPLYPQQKDRAENLVSLSNIEATLELLSSILMTYPVKPNRRVIGHVMGRCILMSVLKMQRLEDKYQCLRLLFRNKIHAIVGIAWILRLVLTQVYRTAFELCRRLMIDKLS